MKLTKNVISRAEALKISKDYVAYAEGNFDLFEKVNDAFSKLKRGQDVPTIQEDGTVDITATGVVIGKVLNIDNNLEYEDFEVEII